MKRLIVLGIAAFLLSACVTTIGDAIKKGGSQLSNDKIVSAVSGLSFKAVAINSRSGPRKYDFVPGGELVVEGHKAGKWLIKEDNQLCLAWPPSLGWTSPGHCFLVVQEAKLINLYDTIINQLRIEMTAS